MKKLSAATLLDVLPESILLDPKLKASAEALSAQLQAVTLATREVLHLPRLDELSGKVLDYLAEQFHIDFFEPLYLTEAEKRNLIRESIAWHRIKGTPAAVEKIAHDAFRDAEIVEWFDYDGKPYHFKIRSHGFKQTPDGWATFARMINVAKNVRSWVDNYELIIDGEEHTVNLFAGNVDLHTGNVEIQPSKPARTFESKIFAGMSNLIFGEVTEQFCKPARTFKVPVHVGQILIRVGQIRVGSETKSHDEDYYGRSWTSKVFAGNVNWIIGHKFWNISPPRDRQADLHGGIVTSKSGQISIGTVTKKRVTQENNLHAAQVLMKVGSVKIGSETQPSDDGNYYGRSWTSKIFAGNVIHKHGSITLKDSSARRIEEKVVVRIGCPIVRSGFVTIGFADNRDDYDFPVEGDWLRLWFDFPNLTRRTLLLKDPRDDVKKSDIKKVGDIAAESELLINSAGEVTTGITRAALIKKSVRKIF